MIDFMIKAFMIALNLVKDDYNSDPHLHISYGRRNILVSFTTVKNKMFCKITI